MMNEGTYRVTSPYPTNGTPRIIVTFEQWEIPRANFIVWRYEDNR